MATNDDMRERLVEVEQKVEQFEKRVDLLATKADLKEFATKEDLKEFATKEDLKEFATKADLKEFATRTDLAEFATKADQETFAGENKSHLGIMLEDAKTAFKSAADGYKGTLDRIERDLGQLNKKVEVKFSDHDKILANHNERIAVLEAPSRPSSGSV